jgi:predicted Rossmann-fold nucleotide-binding protein
LPTSEFLLREELRPVRMQLELLKPELPAAEAGIEATVVIFGSARICRAGPTCARRARDGAAPRRRRCRAPRAQAARCSEAYYEEARRLAAPRSPAATQALRTTPIYVVTGGGPGIMEAGNRGATRRAARASA